MHQLFSLIPSPSPSPGLGPHEVIIPAGAMRVVIIVVVAVLVGAALISGAGKKSNS